MNSFTRCMVCSFSIFLSSNNLFHYSIKQSIKKSYVVK